MTPKYILLADTLRQSLLQNTPGKIDKLPSENTLCTRYGLSRQTVRQALKLLESEGLIEKRNGSGSYATGLGAFSPVIALLVQDEDEYMSPSLISDIRASLHTSGYSTQVYSANYSVAKEREILAAILDSSVRGLISQCCRSALPNPNLDFYERLDKKGVSLLFLNGCYPNTSHFSYIKEDDYYGSYLLGRTLIENGHKRIAAIFQSDELSGRERYYGFITAMRDFQTSFTDKHIFWYDSDSLNALEKKSDTSFLVSFLQKYLKDCSAVICQNDEIAYWLIKELGYAGISVPDDVSVVSFDNSYLSDISPVRITSLSHQKHETGKCAAQTLLKLIKGSPSFSQELPWQLITKESMTVFHK